MNIRSLSARLEKVEAALLPPDPLVVIIRDLCAGDWLQGITCGWGEASEYVSRLPDESERALLDRAEQLAKRKDYDKSVVVIHEDRGSGGWLVKRNLKGTAWQPRTR